MRISAVVVVAAAPAVAVVAVVDFVVVFVHLLLSTDPKAL